MTPSAPVAGQAGTVPTPNPRRFIENMAVNDARADVEAGTSQLYAGMEGLFTGRDITGLAWHRYCLAYRAERCWLLPQEAALTSAMTTEQSPWEESDRGARV